MSHSFFKTAVFLIFVLVLISCESKKAASGSAPTKFFEHLETSFPELNVTSAGFVKHSRSAEIFQLAVGPGGQYLVAADRVGHSILLFNREGSKLLSEVGRKGRGPGEFNTISQIRFGHNNHVYVLDIQLKRITKFKIDHKKLKYQTTLTLKPKPHAFLDDVFVTKYGNFGVYHRIDNYKTMKESYHLFRLNKKFKPQEYLLDMPGNAKVKMANHLYIPGLLSQMIYWDLDGPWFYYIQSKSAKIHKYNIRTGKQQTKQYFHFKDRLNTSRKTDFFKHEARSMIKRFPKAGKAIEETKTIPYFNYFMVHNNHLLFDIFYPGGEGGRILYVNQLTGKTQYIKTSSNVWRFSIGRHVLYGIISMPNGRTRVKMIKLKLGNNKWVI